MEEPAALADEIRARLARERERSTASLRAVRRELSRELRARSGEAVFEVAVRLIEADAPRWLAYELAHHHKGAMAALTSKWLARLGGGLSAWDEVDPFALYLLGPAWREGRVSDAELRRWARSKDHWRRRSAVVATVALNSKARGGTGDVRRTLSLCDLVRDDRDDMVVKALSWALRELARHEPARVARYLAANEARLAARVLREVRSKLSTGLKNPKRGSGFRPGARRV